MTTVLILMAGMVVLGGWLLIAAWRARVRARQMAAKQEEILSRYPRVFEARCRVCGELTAYSDSRGPVHPRCREDRS